MKLLVAVLILSAVVATSGKDVLESVDEKYDGIQTIITDFSQEITYTNGQMSTFSGQLFLEAPDRMKMAVSEPETQLMIANGESLWVYLEEVNQVLVYDLSKEAYPQLGELIFNIAKEFESELMGQTQERYALRLLPMQKSEFYDSLHAKVSRRTYLIKSLAVFDRQGNRIDYDFSNTKTNVPIAEDTFIFIPPQGTQIIKRQ